MTATTVTAVVRNKVTGTKHTVTLPLSVTAPTPPATSIMFGANAVDPAGFTAAQKVLGPLSARRIFYQAGLPLDRSKLGLPAGVAAVVSYKQPSTNDVGFAASMLPGDRIIYHHEPENEYGGKGAAFVSEFVAAYTKLKAANPKLPVGMAAMTYQYAGGRFGQSGSFIPPADHCDFYVCDNYNGKPDGKGVVNDVMFQNWLKLVVNKGKPLGFAEYGQGVNPVGSTTDAWAKQRASAIAADAKYVRTIPGFDLWLYWYNRGAQGDWRFTDAGSVAAWRAAQA